MVLPCPEKSQISESIIYIMMESFYRTLKRELLTDQTFASPKQAKLEIFEYIEFYYNTKRMHSSLGYVSPAQFEDQNNISKKSLNFVSGKP